MQDSHAEAKAFKEALADALGLDWRGSWITDVQIHLHDGTASPTPLPHMVITQILRPEQLNVATKVIRQWELHPKSKGYSVEPLGSPADDQDE